MLTLGQKPTCKEQLQSTQPKHRTKIWNQKQIHCAANMPVPLIIIWPACNAPRVNLHAYIFLEKFIWILFIKMTQCSSLWWSFGSTLKYFKLQQHKLHFHFHTSKMFNWNCRWRAASDGHFGSGSGCIAQSPCPAIKMVAPDLLWECVKSETYVATPYGGVWLIWSWHQTDWQFWSWRAIKFNHCSDFAFEYVLKYVWNLPFCNQEPIVFHQEEEKLSGHDIWSRTGVQPCVWLWHVFDARELVPSRLSVPGPYEEMLHCWWKCCFAGNLCGVNKFQCGSLPRNGNIAGIGLITFIFFVPKNKNQNIQWKQLGRYSILSLVVHVSWRHLGGAIWIFHMKNLEIRFSGLASKNVLGLDAKKAGKKDCPCQFSFHVSQYIQGFLSGEVKTKHHCFKS